MELVLRSAAELELRGIGQPWLAVGGDAGGEGLGPLQMLGASIALSTAAVLESYAVLLGVSTEQLGIFVGWDLADRPYRVGSYRLDIVWPELPDDRVEPVRRAASSCTVHRTLERSPGIVTTVRAGKMVPGAAA